MGIELVDATGESKGPAPTHRDYDVTPRGRMIIVRRHGHSGSILLLSSAEEELSQRVGFDVLAVGAKTKLCKVGDWVLLAPGCHAVRLQPRTSNENEPLEMLVHERNIIGYAHMPGEAPEGE